VKDVDPVGRDLNMSGPGVKLRDGYGQIMRAEFSLCGGEQIQKPVFALLLQPGVSSHWLGKAVRQRGFDL